MRQATKRYATELSILRLVLPGPEAPPDETAVRGRLEPYYAFLDPPPEAPATRAPQWWQGWRSPDGDQHLLLMERFEPASVRGALLGSEIPDPTLRALRRARWALVSAVALDREDPLAAFGRQFRFCAAAVPETVAVHDPCAGRMFSGARLHAIASWSTPPSPFEMFCVHLVSPTAPEEGVWVHTHGLARAGLPDVEMLGVPDDLAVAGGRVVNCFVRAHLGALVPQSGVDEETFRGRPVAWVPLKRALAGGDAEPGGPGDRPPEGSHAGERIALIDPRGRAPSFGPPLEVLRSLADGDLVAQVPQRESERAARLARERWPAFASLFAEHRGRPDWHFDVCVPLVSPRGTSEYLWWSVEEVRDGRLRARLLNEPVDATQVARGAEAWHDVSSVADWDVHGPNDSMGPDVAGVPP